MTPSIDLTAARNTGSPVRVTLDDGRVLIGVPERTPYENYVRINGTAFLMSYAAEVRPA